MITFLRRYSKLELMIYILAYIYVYNALNLPVINI